MVSDMSISQRSSLERMASTVAAFRASTGQFPSPVSDVAAERTLGVWLDNRRRESLNGVLNCVVSDVIDVYLTGWTLTEDDLWSGWARECSDFMTRTDREPNPVGATEAERSLGIWYRSQVGTAALGKLRADRVTWLEEHCRLWAPVALQRPKAGA